MLKCSEELYPFKVWEKETPDDRKLMAQRMSSAANGENCTSKYNQDMW